MHAPFPNLHEDPPWRWQGLQARPKVRNREVGDRGAKPNLGSVGPKSTVAGIANNSAAWAGKLSPQTT